RGHRPETVLLMMVPAYSFAALVAIASCAGPAAAAALAPHRAVYDIRLAHAADRTGIDAIVGRMVYAFTGSPCDGFTTRFRFVMSIQSGEEKRITDQQTTTHEDGDGRSFSFSTRNFVNNTLDREIRGHAEATDEGLTVELSKPQAAAYRLPDGLFPTSHLGNLIERAGRGETFYETAIYDGSDDADAVLTTTVFVGQPAPAADSDAEKKALGTL